MPDREIMGGLVIMGITWLLVYLVYRAILKIADWTLTARDALRNHYGGTHRRPHPIDLVLLPVWLAIEVFCLAAGLVIGLLMLWIVAGAATRFRDWWHQGDRRP